MRLEGKPESKMVQLISEVGKNIDVQFRLGTVTKPFPDLTIEPDNTELKLKWEDGDFIIAEHLTRHERIISLFHEQGKERFLGDEDGNNYGTNEVVKGQIKTENQDKIDVDMSEEGQGPHEHEIKELELLHMEEFEMPGEYEHRYFKIQFEDVLKEEDRVIIASINNNQTHVILDRAVVK